MKPIRSRSSTLFFVRLNRFLRVTSRKMRTLDAQEFVLPQWRETAADTIEGRRAVLFSAWLAFVELSEDDKDRLDQLVENSGLLPLLDDFTNVVRSGSPIREILQVLGSFVIGLGEAADVEAVAPLAGIAGLLKALGYFLGDIALTMNDQAIERIEDKLHFIMDLPKGSEIPPVPEYSEPVSLTEIKGLITILRQGLAFIMDLPRGEDIPAPPEPGSGMEPVSLTLLKQKLDNLANALGEILIGRGIPIEPRPGTVVEEFPHPIKTEIMDLERKLDFIMDLPQGMDIPARPEADSGVQPVSLTEIKVLITILIELLGFAIDLPQGAPLPPRPQVGTPVSLTDIEKKLDFIMDFPPGEGRQIPPVPAGVQPVSLTQIHGTTKKIYVAEEATFTSTAPGDARVIAIRAPAPPPNVMIIPAFDVSGWIDLSEVRDGDAVTVAVDVAFAGRPAVRFNQITFSDAQARPLKHFRDLADGVEAVVGTNVDITVSQSASADNFASQITVGYQFIVESP